MKAPTQKQVLTALERIRETFEVHRDDPGAPRLEDFAKVADDVEFYYGVLGEYEGLQRWPRETKSAARMRTAISLALHEVVVKNWDLSFRHIVETKYDDGTARMRIQLLRGGTVVEETLIDDAGPEDPKWWYDLLPDFLVYGKSNRALEMRALLVMEYVAGESGWLYGDRPAL